MSVSLQLDGRLLLSPVAPVLQPARHPLLVIPAQVVGPGHDGRVEVDAAGTAVGPAALGQQLLGKWAGVGVDPALSPLGLDGAVGGGSPRLGRFQT